MNSKNLVGVHIQYTHKKGSILSSAPSVVQNQKKISKMLLDVHKLPEYSKLSYLGEMYGYYRSQSYWIFVKYLFEFGRYTKKLNDYLALPYSDRLSRVTKLLEKDPSTDKFRKEHIDIFRFLTAYAPRHISSNKHLITREEFIYINNL